MDTRKAFVLLCLLAELLPATISFGSQNRLEKLPNAPHYVVVIGAFSVKLNAKRFTEKAVDLQFKTKYEFNPDRNLYYVFTLTTENKEEAMVEAKRLREQTSFTDSWVYQGTIGEIETPKQDINPITEEKIEDVPTDQVVMSPEPAIKQPVNETPVGDGKKFFFELFRASDRKVVNGDVSVMDIDRARKMGSFKTNDVVYIPSPKSNSGKVALVSKAFGYRTLQVDIDYNNPSGDNNTMDEEKGVVVPFELIRLRKGDIVVMYNVFFYKDAAVMMPESRFEVEALLNMMLENPKCKIRIHGHTNGNAGGKIISQGDVKNFFSLADTKEGIGSAKALSEARAKIIRDFLIDGGVEAPRMEIKAWGGKKGIHDKESAKAKENVRVEVEILEE